MTRRMQANSEFHDRHSHLNSAYHSHCYEHDERSDCKTAPACIPVVRRMVRDGSEHNETDWCTNGGGCTPVVDDTDNATVAVPATGTVLVVDGVVQDVVDIETEEYMHYRQLGPGTSYSLYVPKPKPPFFEVGKTYRSVGSRKKVITVTHVDTHPVKGIPYAHGWIRETYPSGDEQVWAAGLTDRDGWEEEAS